MTTRRSFLVGAALLMQSFLRVLDVNLGFQPERAAALRIDPSFRILISPSRTPLSTMRCIEPGRSLAL